MPTVQNNCFLRQILLNGETEISGYWQELPFYKALKEGKRLDFTSPVTFFVGENGCGKSTLIEAVAVALGFNGEGGSKNFNFSTRDSVSGLYEELITAKVGFERDGYFLRAESLYNVATEIERLDEIPAAAPKIMGGYGDNSLHNQSHGESFLALVQNRFRGNGLYILDEPEAALSPMRLLTLISEIGRLVDKNSQLIVATHSPILLSYPNAKIYRLDNGIEEVSFKDTEHYNITRDFLNNPELYLNKLLNYQR